MKQSTLRLIWRILFRNLIPRFKADVGYFPKGFDWDRSSPLGFPVRVKYSQYSRIVESS